MRIKNDQKHLFGTKNHESLIKKFLEEFAMSYNNANLNKNMPNKNMIFFIETPPPAQKTCCFKSKHNFILFSSGPESCSTGFS